MKKCESNPANVQKPAMAVPFAGDTDSVFFHLNADSPEFKKIAESIRDEVLKSWNAKKNKSASAIFTELIEHCNKSENPVFKMLVEKTTDARKHWRAIVISTIDALIDAGLI